MKSATCFLAHKEFLKDFFLILKLVIDTINKYFHFMSYNSGSNRACNIKSASRCSLASSRRSVFLGAGNAINGEQKNRREARQEKTKERLRAKS